MAKFQRHKFEISTKSTISIILGSNQIDCEESQNRNFVTLGSLLKVPRLKATIKKKIKISKAKLRDCLIGLNQIGHEESESHDPGTP